MEVQYGLDVGGKLVAKKKTKKIKEKVFRKTLSIFADLLGRELNLDLGSQTQASTDGLTIYLPKSFPPAGIRQLQYEIYVLFEHELSHLVFNTNFNDYRNFKGSKPKEDGSLAAWCYNVVEDERVESCWNLIYRTPFREAHRRLFIYPAAQRKQGKKLTLLDVIMDVRGDFIRSHDVDYLTTWKEIQTILKETHASVYTRTTLRVAEKLFEYIKKKGLTMGGNCDLISGKRNRDRYSRQGQRKIRKLNRVLLLLFRHSIFLVGYSLFEKPDK